jgi:hypothetical protein
MLPVQTNSTRIGFRLEPGISYPFRGLVEKPGDLLGLLAAQANGSTLFGANIVSTPILNIV